MFVRLSKKCGNMFCFNEQMPDFVHCKECKCKDSSCDTIAMKGYEYCNQKINSRGLYLHGCNHEECPNVVVSEDIQYCRDHICSEQDCSHKRHSESEESKYCHHHECHIPECTHKRIDNTKPVCEKHMCKGQDINPMTGETEDKICDLPILRK
jgi:hypothetical protein